MRIIIATAKFKKFQELFDVLSQDLHPNFRETIFQKDLENCVLRDRVTVFDTGGRRIAHFQV